MSIRVSAASARRPAARCRTGGPPGPPGPRRVPCGRPKEARLIRPVQRPGCPHRYLPEAVALAAQPLAAVACRDLAAVTCRDLAAVTCRDLAAVTCRDLAAALEQSTHTGADGMPARLQVWPGRLERLGRLGPPARPEPTTVTCANGARCPPKGRGEGGGGCVHALREEGWEGVGASPRPPPAVTDCRLGSPHGAGRMYRGGPGRPAAAPGRGPAGPGSGRARPPLPAGPGHAQHTLKCRLGPGGAGAGPALLAGPGRLPRAAHCPAAAGRQRADEPGRHGTGPGRPQADSGTQRPAGRPPTACEPAPPAGRRPAGRRVRGPSGCGR